MSAPLDHNGLEILSVDDCRRLLPSVPIGRVGVTMGALPVVLPVNFLVHEDRILVRSREGTKLAAAMRGAVVAFEVDDFDPIDHSGWSVMVTGVAEVVNDRAQLEQAARAPIARWAPAKASQVVAISISAMSGRRIPRG